MGGKPEIVTLGEALIAMAPVPAGSLRRAGLLEKHVGGAELNVAVGLARLGHRAGWAGRLGADAFGEEARIFLRGEGVEVSRVTLDPAAPTGVYFRERRALGRLQIYYYRAGSAASRMCPDNADVAYLLSGQILHLTGITAALSEGCHELLKRLIVAANERGVLVSFDANVRWRLFAGRDPRGVLRPLVERVDLLFLSEEEAELLLGASDARGLARRRDALRARMIVVHREDGSFALDGDELVEKPSYRVEAVDTVGAGDAFVAGFLSGRLRGWETGRCLELANACGACAVTVSGDAEGMPAEEEALSLMHGTRHVER